MILLLIIIMISIITIILIMISVSWTQTSRNITSIYGMKSASTRMHVTGKYRVAWSEIPVAHANSQMHQQHDVFWREGGAGRQGGRGAGREAGSEAGRQGDRRNSARSRCSAVQTMMLCQTQSLSVSLCLSQSPSLALGGLLWRQPPLRACNVQQAQKKGVVRPVRLLRVWIQEGLTHTNS